MLNSTIEIATIAVAKIIACIVFRTYLSDTEYITAGRSIFPPYPTTYRLSSRVTLEDSIPLSVSAGKLDTSALHGI